MKASEFVTRKYLDFEIKRIRQTVHLLIHHNKGLRKRLSNIVSSKRHYLNKRLEERGGWKHYECPKCKKGRYK